MRLQNPHAIGQVYKQDKSKPDRLIGNTKFLITVQFVMMLVLMTWVATDLFLTYGAEDNGIIASLSPVDSIQDTEAILSEQKRLLEQFANANAVQKVDDALELRSKATTATQDIFADVEDGDYLIELPNNQLIIYRPETQENIYVGSTADAVFEATNRQIAKEIANLASKQKLISNKSLPLLEEITDIASYIRQDASFFENAKNGDYIAFFPSEFVTIIYDPLSKELVQTATLDYQL